MRKSTRATIFALPLFFFAPFFTVSAQATTVLEAPQTDWVVVEPDPTKPDIYVDENGQVIPLDEDGMPIDRPDGATPLGQSETTAPEARIGCTPYSGRDRPHRSSTGFAASGHGWWRKGNCSNNRADVYNCLYEQGLNGIWYRRDCSTVRRLAPGGGAGNRTTARRNCSTSASRQWRNHVDVDVVGEIDTGEKPMRQATVACHIT